MKNIAFTIAVIAAILFHLSAFSQTNNTIAKPDTSEYPYWIEMMQDPEANFFDVQRAFEIYWQDREITRSSGWKPFKRWEYRMRTRVLPDGERRPADHTFKELQKYKATHPQTKSPAGNWTNLGPFYLPTSKGYEGLGRLNAIAFHPTDANSIFVGSPSGGLWETNDGGNTWESHTDDLPTLGVSAILVNYNNPDLILIGTGDRDAGDAAGMGIFKSDDGGTTWVQSSTGMGNRTVGRLIQHPADANVVFAASNGGILKSEDFGESWVNKRNGDFKDIVFRTDNPSILFATASGNFYRSDDNGETWNEVSNGLPGGARGVIGVTPAQPDYVYFLLTSSAEFKGLYRSTDGGFNFTLMSDSPNIMSWGCEGGSGGQAWYDLDIAVDPLDEDILYAGGVNCFKSIDGGATWEISSHWWGDCSVPAVHADLHVLEWNPVDGRLYAGNDGGIYWTNNGGLTWPEITDGLPISQVYKIGQSATVKDLVINGYQDNGTSTWFGGNGWQTTRGGDGMECAVDHKDAAYTYATVYYGSIDRYYNNNWNGNVASQGNYGITENGAWITPFILDELDENTMFVGYKNVWRCKNVKAPTNQLVWEKISDNLAGSNSSNMAVLEQSPANLGILYAARYDSRLFRTDNAHDPAPEWYDLSSYLPENATPTDLEAHPENPDIVFMTQNNKIYKSIDRGYTWEDFSGTLPNVHLSSIAFYKNNNEGLYLGSDAGVFYRDAFMTDWIWFNNGLPVDASINEIEIYYHPDSVGEDVIRAGTYGRGLWSSDMYSAEPVAGLVASDTLIPVGCAIDFEDMSAGGPHFWAWTFEGGFPETSADKDPAGIVYDTPGTFSVSLKVWNGAGTDSITYEQYITVSETLMPVADFIANDSIPCSGNPVQLTDLTMYCPSAWQWTFEPDDVTFLDGTSGNSQNPVVQLNQPGAYSVTLTVSNNNGQDTESKTSYILNGGFGVPFTEDFENGFNARAWTILNPDRGITWDIHDIIGTTPGNKAAWMNLFDYYALYPHDMLISAPMDFSGYTSMSLTFEHAYAQRHSQVDSLIVAISEDCGETWTKIYTGFPDGQGSFATSPPTTEFFEPQSEEDWCGLGYGASCNILDLTPWAGKQNVKIKFETVGKYGNNLFIDNILINNSVNINDVIVQNDILAVYPNPSSGNLNLRFLKESKPLLIEIYNMETQLVFSSTMENSGGKSIHTVNLGELPAGIYVMKASGENVFFVEKIILK